MDLHPFASRANNPNITDTDFNQNWSAYYAACICALIFGSMQSVQDALDDPFDGISEDDIDMQVLNFWHPTALWSNFKKQKIQISRAKKKTLDPVFRHPSSEIETLKAQPTAAFPRSYQEDLQRERERAGGGGSPTKRQPQPTPPPPSSPTGVEALQAMWQEEPKPYPSGASEAGGLAGSGAATEATDPIPTVIDVQVTPQAVLCGVGILVGKW